MSPLKPLLAILLCSAVFAWADPPRPMVEAAEHLEKARAMLEQDRVLKPARQDAALGRVLSQALSNLEAAKENKGSQLPLAIKAVKAAQAELAGKDNAETRAKALPYVKEALEHLQKIRHNRT